MLGGKSEMQYFGRICFAILLVVANLAVATASSNDGEEAPNAGSVWDFSGEHQPDFDLAPYPGYGDLDVNCNAYRENLFAAYKRKFPRFSASPGQAVLRKKWRHALVLTKLPYWDSANYCFYRHLNERYIRFYIRGEIPIIPYCRIKPEDRSTEFSRAIEALEEMTEYAMRGGQSAIIFIFNLHDRDYTDVHDDLLYYMNLHIRAKVARYGESFDLFADHPHPEDFYDSGNELTPQRRAFIEDAFRRGDFQAVINTTQPCGRVNGTAIDL